ncbi:MAG TPA: DUF1272 domain-containing protein [Candidatus Binatia bacterium]|nr:DUF1272 domain-containing protein [Candidatus Binatia bacterium]
MKNSCERCGRALRDESEARACSYDCTFCADCSSEMNARCPNCGGALLARAGSA